LIANREERVEGGHTKRTIAMENSTMISRNLKNLAAFGARPTTANQLVEIEIKPDIVLK
jgi:hypothetical protein